MIADSVEAFGFHDEYSVRQTRGKESAELLVFEVSILANKRGIWKFAACAKVGGQVAAEAELMCTVRSIE